MPDILEILKPLFSILKKSKLDNLGIIALAMLSMTGRKTMLNISRWTIGELSYRSIQRFFADKLPWLDMMFKVFMLNIFSNQKFILAADETVVTKAGYSTHGIDYFFHGVYQKVMKSLCFSCISIIDTDKVKAYPLFASQLVFTEEEKQATKAKKAHTLKAKGNSRGRKKGSKNSKKQVVLSPTFRLLKEQLEKVMKAIKGKLSVVHIVADGFYSTANFINICNDLGLFLISKLQSNAALYYRFTGKYSGRGRHRIYGERVDIKNLPYDYLVSEQVKDNVVTVTYQLKCLHKQFRQEINTVIVIKENIKTNKAAKAIFFSTDLSLSAEDIIKYYSARFQIEFNFRDAKEFFGMEDFMNITETAVDNAANLSLFMVLMSQICLQQFRQKEKNALLSIRDLISAKRAEKYISETFKLFTKFQPNILMPDNLDSVTSLGRINL